MTDLGCNVTNCVHNEDNQCCCHSIDVRGYDATDKENTCCDAYANRSDTNAKNACCTPNCKVEIRCDAKNCVYNKSMNCTASHVRVTSPQDRVHGETECDTFMMR